MNSYGLLWSFLSGSVSYSFWNSDSYGHSWTLAASSSFWLEFVSTLPRTLTPMNSYGLLWSFHSGWFCYSFSNCDSYGLLWTVWWHYEVCLSSDDTQVLSNTYCLVTLCSLSVNRWHTGPQWHIFVGDIMYCVSDQMTHRSWVSHSVWWHYEVCPQSEDIQVLSNTYCVVTLCSVSVIRSNRGPEWHIFCGDVMYCVSHQMTHRSWVRHSVWWHYEVCLPSDDIQVLSNRYCVLSICIVSVTRWHTGHE